MASSLVPNLSKSKLFSLSLYITRRGYAAMATAQVGAGFGWEGCMSSVLGTAEDRRVGMKASVSSDGYEASKAWAPDPLTGYYRPANCGGEIDPAELRRMLLNHKPTPL